jgi:chromate transporter
MLSSLCFTLPSAVLLILFGYGVSALGDLRHAGWLHGLKVAAVAVVAQAVWGMGKKLCPDAPRLGLALAATALVLALPGTFVPVGVIATGALIGFLLFRNKITPTPVDSGAGLARHHLWAAGALVAFGALLFVLPVIVAATHSRDIGVFDSFYRAGALVFGGGHVVLPLLRAEFVPTGLIADDAFLAGYGAAQAVPGPLFTLAGYLGTVIHGGPHAWIGGALGILAIFLPAWLLIGGALPFWHLLRSKSWIQAALRGANAAVVGVLLAALWNPVGREGVTGVVDLIAAVVLFALLEFRRVPAWLVVALAAAAGPWL